jgi:hypothetical protein
MFSGQRKVELAASQMIHDGRDLWDAWLLVSVTKVSLVILPAAFRVTYEVSPEESHLY